VRAYGRASVNNQLEMRQMLSIQGF
jgi:hypothetical protein